MNRLYWVSIAACNITTWDGVIFFDDETQNIDDIGVMYYGFRGYDEYKDAYNASTDTYHANLIDHFHRTEAIQISYSPHRFVNLCHRGIIKTETDYWATDSRLVVYAEYCESFNNGSNSKFIFPKISDITATLRYKKIPKDKLWYCLDWKG